MRVFQRSFARLQRFQKIVFLVVAGIFVSTFSAGDAFSQSPFGFGSAEPQPVYRQSHQPRKAKTHALPTQQKTIKNKYRKKSRRTGRTVRYYKGGSATHGTVSVVRGTFSPRMPVRSRRQREAYRSVCVRVKDGYFWPLSFASKAKRLGDDEALCQASCSSEVKLYYYANPGETIDDMRDLEGQYYRDLETAYLFRTKYVREAQCRPQPWSRESRHLHASLEQTEREMKLLNTLEENLAKSLDSNTAKLSLHSGQKKSSIGSHSENGNAVAIKVNMVLLSALRATTIDGMAIVDVEQNEIQTAQKSRRGFTKYGNQQRLARQKRQNGGGFKELHSHVDAPAVKPRRQKTSKYALGVGQNHRIVRPKSRANPAKKRKKKVKWYKKMFKGSGKTSSRRKDNSPFFSF